MLRQLNPVRYAVVVRYLYFTAVSSFAIAAIFIATIIAGYKCHVVGVLVFFNPEQYRRTCFRFVCFGAVPFACVIHLSIVLARGRG